MREEGWDEGGGVGREGGGMREEGWDGGREGWEEGGGVGGGEKTIAAKSET